jgi:hypothetical protein
MLSVLLGLQFKEKGVRKRFKYELQIEPNSRLNGTTSLGLSIYGEGTRLLSQTSLIVAIILNDQTRKVF